MKPWRLKAQRCKEKRAVRIEPIIVFSGWTALRTGRQLHLLCRQGKDSEIVSILLHFSRGLPSRQYLEEHPEVVEVLKRALLNSVEGHLEWKDRPLNSKLFLNLFYTIVSRISLWIFPEAWFILQSRSLWSDRLFKQELFPKCWAAVNIISCGTRDFSTKPSTLLASHIGPDTLSRRACCPLIYWVVRESEQPCCAMCSVNAL